MGIAVATTLITALLAWASVAYRRAIALDTQAVLAGAVAVPVLWEIYALLMLLLAGSMWLGHAHA